MLSAALSVCPAGGARTTSGAQEKSARQNDFLIFGTVFTEQGFSFPGAQIRVRRAGERKVRWEAMSDRRGEFAIRVPSGAEYEMTVSAKGHVEQNRKVSAKDGNREDVVFRMSRSAGEKRP